MRVQHELNKEDSMQDAEGIIWTKTVTMSMVWAIYFKMKKYGFKQCNSDHTLFLKHRQGYVTALIIYEDDMIIIGDDIEEIYSLQKRSIASRRIWHLNLK